MNEIALHFTLPRSQNVWMAACQRVVNVSMFYDDATAALHSPNEKPP